MSLNKSIFSILSVCLLTACGHYSEDLAAMDRMNRMDTVVPHLIEPAAGHSFNTYLASEYMALAHEENTSYDYKSAALFTKKAKAAQQGKVPPPSKIDEYDLPEEAMKTATMKREKLVSALQTQNTPENYAALARAQVQFDKWLEESEEGHQQAAIKNCSDSFEAAMMQLGNPLADEVNYTIHFGAQDTALTQGSITTIQDVARFFGENPDYDFMVIGHSAYGRDTAASRAGNVREALVQAGVPAMTIRAYTQKEQATFYKASATPTPTAISERVNIILRKKPQPVM